MLRTDTIPTACEVLGIMENVFTVKVNLLDHIYAGMVGDLPG